MALAPPTGLALSVSSGVGAGAVVGVGAGAAASAGTNTLSGPHQLTVNDINVKFNEYMRTPDNVTLAANYVYDTLIDDITMGVIFEYHQGIKTGITEALLGDTIESLGETTTNIQQTTITPNNNTNTGTDVFGVCISTRRTQDCSCSCPNCDRSVSATRFAPHLEKCMGMGRNSSRIASRRIASNSKEPALYAGLLSDDEDDADWVGDRRKKKLRNNGVRKQAKINNGTAKVTSTNGNSSENSNSSQEPSGVTYETMTWNEKKNLLLQICGVVSEHTKKICTRSTRCPQHTEDQRKMLRNSVLDPTLNPEHNDNTSQTPHDVGSPPDSSPSSTCSSSSRKKDRHRSKGSKGRRDKNHSPGKE